MSKQVLRGAAKKAAERKAALAAQASAKGQSEVAAAIQRKTTSTLSPSVQVSRVRGENNPNADEPFYITEGHTSRIPLKACRYQAIMPQVRALIPTNMKISLPDGVAAFVYPTSQLLHSQGLLVSPLEIKSGQEVILQVFNPTRRQVQLSEGDLVGELVFVNLAVLTVEIPEGVQEVLQDQEDLEGMAPRKDGDLGFQEADEEEEGV